MFIRINLLMIFFIVSLFSQDKTVITYHSQSSNKDKRKLYEIELLKLSLDKTIEKYGSYELKASSKMNLKRAYSILNTHKIKNFILKSSLTYDLSKRYAYTKFPVDRGVLSYRIAFISPKIKEKIKDIKDLDELKKLKIGQGIAWLD